MTRWLRGILSSTAAALGLVALVSPASALTVDGSGNVTNWGVTPYQQTGSAGGNHAAWAPVSPSSTTCWIEENNYSRAAYPSGIGHLPSPGNATGENYDLEALYWRLNGGNLQVLLVTSAPAIQYNNDWRRYYRLGDLFIDVDGGGYDFAVATTDSTAGGAQPWLKYVAGSGYSALAHSAAPGSLFAIGGAGDLVGVVGSSAGGYGDNAGVATMVYPWVVNQASATQVGSVALETATYSYGSSLYGGGYYADDPYYAGGLGSKRSENNSWFYEWTIPLSVIDSGSVLNETTIRDLGLHIAIECGNDFIGGSSNVELLQPIPEPATISGLLLATAGLARYLRRRSKASQA